MNVSVIGSKGLASKLGKKGTASDIALYNTSYGGKHFTFVEPETYPEKPQTLFQSMNMSQFSVIYITGETPRNAIGECILAVDMLKKPGMIVTDSFHDDVRQLLKGTFLENFNVTAANATEIMPILSGFNVPVVDGKPRVVIDHSFDVKSVGTIALGTVMSGVVKKHDSMTLYPAKKDVTIKSIQIHDKECDSGACSDRVGLSLKGAEVSDIPRGSVVSSSAECVKEMDVIFEKNKFFREEMPKNVMCVVGLQYVNAVLEGGKLAFGKEVVFFGEDIIVLAPEKKMRIAGIARKS